MSEKFRNFALELGSAPQSTLWTSASDDVPTLKGHEPVPVKGDAIARSQSCTAVRDEAALRQRWTDHSSAMEEDKTYG